MILADNVKKAVLAVCLYWFYLMGVLHLLKWKFGNNMVSNFDYFRFQMITLGGDAELELVDSLDPFSEGVVFSVRPPKKSWKNIANLSGGEKVFFILVDLSNPFSFHRQGYHMILPVATSI